MDLVSSSGTKVVVAMEHSVKVYDYNWHTYIDILTEMSNLYKNVVRNCP